MLTFEILLDILSLLFYSKDYLYKSLLISKHFYKVSRDDYLWRRRVKEKLGYYPPNAIDIYKLIPNYVYKSSIDIMFKTNSCISLSLEELINNITEIYLDQTQGVGLYYDLTEKYGSTVDHMFRSKLSSIGMEYQVINEFLDIKNSNNVNINSLKLHPLYSSYYNFVNNFIKDKIKCKRNMINIEIFLNHVDDYMFLIKIKRIEINKIYS